ncbi:ankyrin repeat domain-containing protein [Legionella shakespearei]|uniref:Ankyrin repeat protein n=1 Tax=Legionella shakespearei DSM 23087 TaxID=1122169 RepID=A0A0W0YZR4_9GAMM|nr:ankyrin repeat domain-containing protein [Legionella shakespearei]KTD62347.1 Ankyrin repeat protein [Legionella shakespearei DSM 23087]
MITTFDGLRRQLNLSQQFTSKEQLNDLASWCKEHISQDVVFTGTDKERYTAYMKLAEHYLTVFLPVASRDFSAVDPALNHMNCIQYAAYKGYDRFLAQKAELFSPELLNKGNVAGMTPLHLAALAGHIYTVNQLLSLGVLPDKINNNKQFPLYTALVLPIIYEAKLKQTKIGIFRLLLAKMPALVNAVDTNGDTVAHLMASNGFDTLIQELPRHLLFVTNNFLKYPIHVAILNRQLSVVEKLMSIPEMSGVRDAEKRTPLHYAAQYGTEEFAALCFKDKKSLEARDTFGMTPLLSAAKSGNLPVVQWLVGQMANVNATDCQGQTLWDLAAQSKNNNLMVWVSRICGTDANSSQEHQMKF